MDVNAAREGLAAFRMPVQWVNRPNLDFRGFAGLIAGVGLPKSDLAKAFAG